MNSTWTAKRTGIRKSTTYQSVPVIQGSIATDVPPELPDGPRCRRGAHFPPRFPRFLLNRQFIITTLAISHDRDQPSRARRVNKSRRAKTHDGEGVAIRTARGGAHVVRYRSAEKSALQLCCKDSSVWLASLASSSESTVGLTSLTTVARNSFLRRTQTSCHVLEKGRRAAEASVVRSLARYYIDGRSPFTPRQHWLTRARLIPRASLTSRRTSSVYVYTRCVLSPPHTPVPLRNWHALSLLFIRRGPRAIERFVFSLNSSLANVCLFRSPLLLIAFSTSTRRESAGYRPSSAHVPTKNGRSRFRENRANSSSRCDRRYRTEVAIVRSCNISSTESTLGTRWRPSPTLAPPRPASRMRIN